MHDLERDIIEVGAIVDWKKDLGKQILQARGRLGLSQDELAAATKLSRQTINLCENGRRGPSVPAFVRLAFALRTSLDVSGHKVRVERGRRKPVPEQFCLPFGITRIYSGAVVKMCPTKARLTIEASVKRVVF
jgi:DNA-binding XRE family transcriptional regulator